MSSSCVLSEHPCSLFCGQEFCLVGFSTLGCVGLTYVFCLHLPPTSAPYQICRDIFLFYPPKLHLLNSLVNSLEINPTPLPKKNPSTASPYVFQKYAWFLPKITLPEYLLPLPPCLPPPCPKTGLSPAP